MTLGEIKAEALKIMFVDTVTDYEGEDIDALLGDEYCRDYLVNMPGAINRCFANLETRGVIPQKRFVIDGCGDVFGGKMRIDISLQIPDCCKLSRIIKEDDEGGYEGSCSYMKEGDTLVLAVPGEGERYIIVYHPLLERITSLTANDTVIALPDRIAALIPYFIKGELFRADEPDEAQEARRWYEEGISEMIPEPESVQTHVKSVYWEDI